MCAADCRSVLLRAQASCLTAACQWGLPMHMKHGSWSCSLGLNQHAFLHFHAGEGRLNHMCGADYVQKEQAVPAGPCLALRWPLRVALLLVLWRLCHHQLGAAAVLALQ